MWRAHGTSIRRQGVFQPRCKHDNHVDHRDDAFGYDHDVNVARSHDYDHLDASADDDHDDVAAHDYHDVNATNHDHDHHACAQEGGCVSSGSYDHGGSGGGASAPGTRRYPGPMPVVSAR